MPFITLALALSGVPVRNHGSDGNGRDNFFDHVGVPLLIELVHQGIGVGTVSGLVLDLLVGLIVRVLSHDPVDDGQDAEAEEHAPFPNDEIEIISVASKGQDRGHESSRPNIEAAFQENVIGLLPIVRVGGFAKVANFIVVSDTTVAESLIAESCDVAKSNEGEDNLNNCLEIFIGPLFFTSSSALTALSGALLLLVFITVATTTLTNLIAILFLATEVLLLVGIDNAGPIEEVLLLVGLPEDIVFVCLES